MAPWVDFGTSGIPYSGRSLRADTVLPTCGGLGTATYYSRAGQGFQSEGRRLVKCVSGKVMIDSTTVVAQHPADPDGGGPSTWDTVSGWVDACDESLRQEPVRQQPVCKIINSCDSLASLPVDLLRLCLLKIDDPQALLRVVACASSWMCSEARDNDIWLGIYRFRWPEWTLLRLSETELLPAPPPRHWFESYRSRVTDSCPVQMPAGRVFVLSGHARDESDGNVAPLAVALCRADGRVSSSLGEGGANKLLAQVRKEAGSLRNEPSCNMWFGSLVSNNDGGEPGVQVKWQEQCSAFSHWAYSGQITPDGRQISGTYHLSILPRKKGTFQLNVLDPQAQGSSSHWFYDERPTAEQLSGRVMLQWLRKGQGEREAREGMVAGAALLD